jgi:hypothetical protein
MKISNDTIGNRSRDLPVCSAVPQPLRLNRARLALVEPALFEGDVFEVAAPIQSPAKCEVCSYRPTCDVYLVLGHGNIMQYNTDIR